MFSSFLNHKSYFILLISLCFLLPSFVSAGTIRKPPNNLGLTGYWTFDDGTGGIATDASGNGRHGILTSMDTATAWISGKRGKALQFDGTDDNIVTNTTVSNFLTATDGTISVWVRPTGSTVNASSMDVIRNTPTAVSTSGIFELGIHRANVTGLGDKIWLYNSTTGSSVGVDYTVNEWTHITWVHTGGVLYAYKNGALIDSVSSGNTSLSNNLLIGKNWCCNAATNHWRGDLDDVRTYNRALTASEVLALYQSGSAKIGITDLNPGTLKNGLTGHWTFDGKDMTSNVADVSGNGRHGYLMNFTSTTTSIGKIGQAVRFDGSNDYVNTNSTITNFLSATDGTISAWVRPTGASYNTTSGIIYGAPPAVSTSAVFAALGIMRANLTDLGQDRIWAFNYDGNMDKVGVTYNIGEWVHITWMHSGGTLSIYKNGEFVDSAASGSTSSFTGTLYIGTNWIGAQKWWNGDIDDVRTWNRGLTASEIKQVYNIGAGQKVATTKTPVGTLQTGLTGHWTFDGADINWSTSKAIDKSGNGRDGSIVNATPVVGKSGQALNFGTTKYIVIPSNSTVQPEAGVSFSVSLWYKGVDTGSKYFIAAGLIPGNYWHIKEEESLFFSNTESTLGTIVSYTLPSDNEWHHLVAVLDRVPSPDVVTVYLDGISQGSSTETMDGGSASGFGDIRVARGNFTGAGVYRSGPIDEVRIYNRALSASEVKQLYNLGK